MLLIDLLSTKNFEKSSPLTFSSMHEIYMKKYDRAVFSFATRQIIT